MMMYFLCFRRDNITPLKAAVIFKNAPLSIVVSLEEHGADMNFESADPQDQEIHVREMIPDCNAIWSLFPHILIRPKVHSLYNDITLLCIDLIPNTVTWKIFVLKIFHAINVRVINFCTNDPVPCQRYIMHIIFIFVPAIKYENILTTKISQITVVYYTTNIQDTALTLASYHGHADIVKRFLERGVQFKPTSMEYAVTKGNELVIFLLS